MLQLIRDRSQGVIAFIIIIFLVLTFALWGVHNYFDGSAAKKPVAKVNGKKITEEEFSMNFDRFRQAHIESNPSLFSSQAAINKVKQEMLESMVTTSLLTQSADDAGFNAGQELLALMIGRMPIFQVNGQFSKVRYQQFLSGMMYSQDAFLSMLRDSIILSQVRSGFVQTSFALPYQVDNAMALTNQARAFQYVMISPDRFQNSAQVSSDAARAYYQAHQKEFSVPRKVSLEYVILSLPKVMQGIHPTEQQLQQYYANNINHFTQPKKWQLAHILVAVAPDADEKTVAAAQTKAKSLLKQARQSKSFAALAKQNSDDLATASKGGDLGWTTLLQKNAQWQHQMLALKKVGDMVGPFRTQNGFEILELVATKKAVVEPYEKVVAKVKKDYMQQAAEKKFGSLNEKLANLTFEHPNSLQPAAKALGLQIQTTPLFTQAKGGNTALTKNPKIVSAAFSNDVLGQGNNSDVLQLTDTDYVVLRVKQKVPASIEPYASVANKINAKLAAQQTSNKAKALANAMLAKLQQGESLSKIAAANNLKVEAVSKPVTRNHANGINPSILNAAFHLAEPTKQSISADVTPADHGAYALVQLTHVSQKPLQKGNLTAIKSYYNTGTAHELGELAYALYIQGLHQTAKIQYYDNLSETT